MANYTHQIQTMLERVTLRLSALNQKGFVIENTKYKLQILEISLLKQVNDSPGIAINEVAKTLFVERVEVAKALKKLVAYKLVDKKQSEVDKRSVLLTLNEKGVQVLEAYNAKEQLILEELLSKMTINDEKTILKFLSTISQMTDPNRKK